jgi:hypothetical protein
MSKKNIWERKIRLAALIFSLLTAFVPTASAQQPVTSLIGEYKSDAFYPRPLILTITAVGHDGTIHGYMKGMRPTLVVGQGYKYEWWEQVFGRSWTASYNGNEVVVVANGKVRHRLRPTTFGLEGDYFDPPDDQSLVFRKTPQQM